MSKNRKKMHCIRNLTSLLRCSFYPKSDSTDDDIQTIGSIIQYAQTKADNHNCMDSTQKMHTTTRTTRIVSTMASSTSMYFITWNISLILQLYGEYVWQLFIRRSTYVFHIILPLYTFFGIFVHLVKVDQAISFELLWQTLLLNRQALLVDQLNIVEGILNDNLQHRHGRWRLAGVQSYVPTEREYVYVLELAKENDTLVPISVEDMNYCSSMCGE